MTRRPEKATASYRTDRWGDKLKHTLQLHGTYAYRGHLLHKFSYVSGVGSEAGPQKVRRGSPHWCLHK